MTVSADGIVTGNTYDKYGSANPLVRRLMAGFERDAGRAVRRAPSRARCWTSAAARACSCSAGPAQPAAARVVGIDLEEESIQAGWAEHQAPNLEYRTMAAERPAVRRRRVRPGDRDRGARARARPRAHACRDGALRRAPPARVGPARAAVAHAEHGARRLLVGSSATRPGHLNHWSKRSFVRLLARHGEVVETRSPFPWTMLLVRL